MATQMKVVPLKRRPRADLLKRLDAVRAKAEEGFFTGLAIAGSTVEGGIYTLYEGDDVFLMIAALDALQHRIRVEYIETE